MTAGTLAMLVGIFGVPLVLLWMGHRLRRRPARWRQAFWGAIAGHIAAIVIGSIAAMVPPEEWGAGDLWRGFFALWSFAVLPAFGALIGWMRGAR